MTFHESDARRELQNLIDIYNKLDSTQRENITESGVVHQFLDTLFEKVLGWPVNDSQRFKYELNTVAGRPDMTLFPDNREIVFVEAKRLGVIKELREARVTTSGVITPGQMALPGMAVDRNEQEQQAINYAFENGGTWAILTNFEKLRLFNARRDWLVLSFENPKAYLDDFDLFFQLAYHNILDGSLDRLSQQRHTRNVDTDYLSFINEWRLRLARHIIENPDRNPWAFHADGTIDLAKLRATVQRFLDRLVIVRFAEDHLVIPPSTLRDFYDLRLRNPYTHSMDEFLDRFFRRFDEFHNSALFAPGTVDDTHFADQVLMQLIGKLYEARYRSMPADIIGNTYEQYLGETLALDNGTVTARSNLETRKKQGSYYTPQVIVRYLVDNSLGRYLYGTEDGTPDGDQVPGETRKTSRDIRDLRVLDSACGSGSFLIYAYQVLADFYESEIERLQHEQEQRNLELAADGVDPLDRRMQLADYTAELNRIADYPRLILEHHIYGVDLDPQAAEIAVVNLIMRAMERRRQHKRLPLILNQNIKVGNSLIGTRPDDSRMADFARELALIRELRRNLIDTPQGPDHDQILADLTAVTADLNAELDAEFDPHFSDLDRVRPFHWGVEFPEVFYNEDGQPLENPGFTIIIGNPPWEIVKPDLREFYAQFDEDVESKLNRRQVEQRIEELNAEDPRLIEQWEKQKNGVEESSAFIRQSEDYTRQGRGDTATHKLFLERMYGLLCDRGRLGYVVPSGIYTDLGTKDLREMLLNEGNIQYIFSFSNERWFFPGVHHSFKFVLLGAQKGPQSEGFWAAFRFNPRVAVAPDDLPTFLAERDNLLHIKRHTLKRFSPESLSVLEFQNQRDYKIAETIYNDWPAIGENESATWSLSFSREFDMANDSNLFNQRQVGFPLYEGKMIHQFDPYFSDPRYWIEESLGAEKLSNSQADSWFRGFRFAFRAIARPTDERTCITTVLPPNTFTGHSIWVGVTRSESTLLYFISVFNSYCVDWVARFQVNANVTLFVVKQLPLPRLEPGDPHFDAIVPRAARLICTRPEFADLWSAVMGEPWHESDGATDPAERQQLRDDIDSIVAHLYGLSRRDFDHILGTFPLVFPNDDDGRAKRAALLDTFDYWSDKL